MYTIHIYVFTYCELEKAGSMIRCSLPVHDLGEEQLLEGVTVCKHARMLQARLVRWHVGPVGHGHFIEGLSMGSLDVLHHHVAMDEVRTDPRRIEGGPAVV